MTKSMLCLITSLMLALGAGPVLAQQRAFVGQTATTTPANVGILALHAMCDAQISGARMCSTADILANGGVGAPPISGDPPLLWINPSLVAGDAAFQLDASGVGSGASASGSLSCFNWSVNFATVAGTTLSQSRISASSCDNEYAVACCIAPKK
jgi:hypothetical protein